MPKPTKEQFLNDPAFQGDRDLFEAMFDAFIEKKKKAAEAERVKQGGEKTLLQQIFDGE